jgi:hypothetical protein
MNIDICSYKYSYMYLYIISMELGVQMDLMVCIA